MGSLIRRDFLAVLCAILLVPVGIVLAILGLPLLLVGGAILAIPLLVLACLPYRSSSSPECSPLVLVVMTLVALKIAFFVVLPIALLIMIVSWLARTSREHHDRVAA